jgi:hypothetical protein
MFLGRLEAIEFIEEFEPLSPLLVQVPFLSSSTTFLGRSCLRLGLGGVVTSGRPDLRRSMFRAWAFLHRGAQYS